MSWIQRVSLYELDTPCQFVRVGYSVSVCMSWIQRVSLYELDTVCQFV